MSEHRDAATALSRTASAHSASLLRIGEGDLSAREVQRLHDLTPTVRPTAEIAVVGDASAGKSSLIRALVDRPELLPENQDVASNIEVRIQHTDGDGRAVVRFEDPDAAPQEIPLEEIGEWVSEQNNPSNIKGVDEVEAYVDHPLTEAGLIFVDTPGIAAIVGHGQDIARLVMEEASCALIVVEPPSYVESTHEEFFEMIAGSVERAIIVINKAEEIDIDARIAEVSEKLTKSGNPLASAPIFAVSARTYLQASDSTDDYAEEQRAASGIPQLRDALEAYSIADEILREAHGFCVEVDGPAASLQQVFTQVCGDGLNAEEQARLVELRRQLQELSVPPDYAAVANLERIVSQNRDRLHAGLDKVGPDLVAALDDHEILPEDVAKDLETRIKSVWAAAISDGRREILAALDVAVSVDEMALAKLKESMPSITALDRFDADLDQVGHGSEYGLTRRQQRVQHAMKLADRMWGMIRNPFMGVFRGFRELREDGWRALVGERPRSARIKVAKQGVNKAVREALTTVPNEFTRQMNDLIAAAISAAERNRADRIEQLEREIRQLQARPDAATAARRGDQLKELASLRQQIAETTVEIEDARAATSGAIIRVGA